MKVFNNIFAVVWASLAFVGCQQGVPVGGNEGDINIPIVPAGGYITFETDMVSRGALIEGTLAQNFDVLGYKYTGDWDVVKVMAAQNVFDKKPQTVVYKDNYHTYNSIKGWELSSKYAFFAYSPSKSDSDKLKNGTGITTISEGYEGDPYVDYTIGYSNGNHSAVDLVDVVTGCVVNTDGLNSKSVTLSMKHRLAAIDISARNFVDKSQYGNGVNSVNVLIKNLSITFNDIRYNTVRIPLNTLVSEELILGAEQKISKSYGILGTNYTTITPTINSDGEGGEQMVLSSGKSMILIPQNKKETVFNDGTANSITRNVSLTGTLKFTYQYVSGDDNITLQEDKEKTQDFYIDKDLKQGRRYFVQINFSNSGVTIAIIESEEWDDKNIYHDFE